MTSGPSETIATTPLPSMDALPTMHDLPSDDPLEPGLPDEFHGIQPQLLAETLRLTDYAASEIFCAFDLNLYYDPNNTSWYKRPDWFLVVGVPRLYRGKTTRSSYVTWDEKVNPVMVIEFLSPGTEAEDLGPFANKPLPASPPGKPPNKFTVYEQILQIPNYLVFNEADRRLRYFRLVDGQYEEQAIAPNHPLIWIPEIKLALGLWNGTFRGIPQHWLRWCDAEGNWLLTDTEVERQAKERERLAKERERLAKERERFAKERERLAKEQAELREQQERLAKEQAQQARARLEAYLRSQGIDPDNLP
ncbi:Uma2 family endonuclease [Alkalinema sp. FACHB-956]|uniref:Uma2 family endonuclease n=1 Tax=Alkalinema sp. FACHB-956 TaxID=2692768 RepID=UPI001687E475|nr:Uma2 family endonuclease [Alkalinema sp. FACHB-956]MBD2327898.1 Uma2 family endonuclease [Alkalinema sp. FACHB-956]